MSRSTRLALLAILPAAVLSIGAFAQDASTAANARPSLFQHMLQKMDTNGDGRISEDEFLAAATTRFKSIDTQNAGSVSATQMANSPAAAERLQQHAQFLVQHLDKAGNGYVTKDEFVAAAQKRFARMDKNGDGRLTPDELTLGRFGHGHARVNPNASPTAADNAAQSTRRAQFAQKAFAKLDTNHDGFVTQDEYVAAAVAKFQQLDTLGNGQVTASEIATSPKATARAEKVAEHVVKRLDTNGDGVVSLDEYLAAAKKRFSHMDRNGDGYIDADELPAHHWARGVKAAPTGG